MKNDNVEQSWTRLRQMPRTSFLRPFFLRASSPIRSHSGLLMRTTYRECWRRSRSGTSERGARFQRPVRRNAFLLGCLAFSGALKEEHLIVGYGYRYGKTTGVERLHHVVGEERNVSIPIHVNNEIRRHHHSETDAEVIVFHNHPRIGNEGEGLYFIKAILEDLPIPSSQDRGVLQHYAFNLVGLARQLLNQGRVLFYLGESKYVKQFNLPQLLPFLEQLDRTPVKN